MSFLGNLEYLWSLLPEWMRRQDEEQTPPDFLKRFVSFFAKEMDDADRVVDELHQLVAPATASEAFLNWWLWAFFGWAWFPVWMTLDQKRAFYSSIATHYARRGTARGIVEFLAAFGIRSRVINQPIFYDEFTTDEDEWCVETPLVFIVQIFPQMGGLDEDLSFYGEYTTEENHIADPALVPTRPDIDALLRFQQPAGHIIIIEEKIAA
jgi:phage tail-like protein